jgi:hypothetical protein
MTPELQESDQVLEEYLELLASGRKDDELLARSRDRADDIHKEMKAKYGHRSIAIELIREVGMIDV